MPATALMTAGSGYTFEEARADRTFWGRIVESAVGAHLLNTATSDIRVYYWRDGQHEVDFVLRRGPRLVGIEVKSGPMRRSPRGLETFEERFKPERILVVGEAGVPLNEFLAAPAGYWCEEE
jgi:predicted AAA+ superfamily ATPase